MPGQNVTTETPIERNYKMGFFISEEKQDFGSRVYGLGRLSG
jgi:hypothetical protein